MKRNLCLSFFLLASLSFSQVGETKRAFEWRERTQGKVNNGPVIPNWLSDEQSFWYVNQPEVGKKQFLLVRTQPASKVPAFDHVRMAEALSKTLDTKVAADNLPIDRIRFDSDTDLRIQVGQKAYKCSLSDYVLSQAASIPTGPRLLAEATSHVSPFYNEDLPEHALEPEQFDVGRKNPGRVTFKDNQAFLDSEGGSTQITTDGESKNRYEGPAQWSPDGRFCVFRQTVPTPGRKVTFVISSPTDQLQPKVREMDYLKPGDPLDIPRLVIYDSVSKSIKKLDQDFTPNPWSIDRVRWEADSKTFTFLYNQRGHQQMKWVEVTAESGSMRAVIDESVKTFIDWTNKVFLQGLPDTSEAIWMSERSGYNHLYLIDFKSGKVKNPITSGNWVVRRVENINVDTRTATFWASGFEANHDPYQQYLCQVKFDGTGFKNLTPGDGDHTVTRSPNREFMVDVYSRPDLAPVSVLRNKQGEVVLQLQKADWQPLAKEGWKAPERFVAKGRDGKTDIYGLIYRPTDFQPGKKYPVIEEIYAGPQGSFVPKSFRAYDGKQALAELGFIVVQIDGMGTSNRSKAFHDVCHQNLADAGFPDRKLWLRVAASKYKELDLQRVGIFGTSAGGQNALHALELHGDMYKVGVADCGCYDNRMDKVWWNEQWMGYPIGPHYEAQSGSTLANKITGKLLLLLGEVDSNVDPASTMQVVNALIKANISFDMLTMPNVGHGAIGTTYARKKMYEFFITHLQPGK